MTYREEVLRTANTDYAGIRKRLDDGGLMLLEAAIGLSGESGELLDLLKKGFFHGQDTDYDRVIREIGDIRWYLERACIALHTSLEAVEEANVAKLRLRYPDGFSVAAADAREDVMAEIAAGITAHLDKFDAVDKFIVTNSGLMDDLVTRDIEVPLSGAV